MLARRIIVVSPDPAFAKQLVVALKAAGGTVDAHAQLAELGTQIQAALVVVHLDGELAAQSPELLARLVGDTRVIAVLPRANLAAVVDIMQASERVAGMLVAEDFDARRLSAMATRVLAGDIFGADKLLLWGTQIHSALVGDYQEKALCISQVSEFAHAMGVRRKYRESIEQCLDEMLMNALYDAPVDEAGRQVFSEIPTKTRISLRLDQKAVVQYACDGHQFIVAVRDAFGTLERATVLRYLHKCLHSEQQIDRKVGGAGLGLYLMTNASSTVYFNVLPGVATEAVCIFDLDQSKMQLEAFGFFHEKIDAGGRLATGPSRRLPSHPVERRAQRPAPQQPRWIIGVLIAAIVVTLALTVVAAWPRLFGSKKTQVTITTVPAGAVVDVEGKNVGTATDGTLVVRELDVGRAYPVIARKDGYETKQAVVQPRAGDNRITLELRALAPTVRVDSSPTGAQVQVDGVAAGTTPLLLGDVRPGQTLELTFAKTGYQPATARLEVPGPGKETRLIQPLAVSGDLARVRLTSEPPGAQVVQNGQVLAGVVTPTEVLVEAGKLVRFTLTQAGKVPATIEAFTPGRGETGLARSATLVDGHAVTVSSNMDGKVSIVGVVHCQGLSVPATCVVAPGAYTLELAVERANKLQRALTVSAARDEKFELGIVEAGANKQLELAGKKLRRAAFEPGPRTVTVIGAPGEPPHSAGVIVKPGATVIAN